jgi:hypothetical protein
VRCLGTGMWRLDGSAGLAAPPPAGVQDAARGCTEDAERSIGGERAERGQRAGSAQGGPEVWAWRAWIEDPTPNPTRRRGGRGRGLHLGLLGLALWPVAPCLGYYRAAQIYGARNTSQTGLGLHRCVTGLIAGLV